MNEIEERVSKLERQVEDLSKDKSKDRTKSKEVPDLNKTFEEKVFGKRAE